MDQGLMNDIISTSVGGAAGGAVAGLALYLVQQAHEVIKDCRDSSRVYKWLSTQGWGPGVGDFRSTRTIASYTNLTEDRVRYICSKHPKIFLSTGPKADMWGSDEDMVRAIDSLPD